MFQGILNLIMWYFLLVYRVFWTWTTAHLYRFLKERFLERLGKVRKFHTLSKIEKERMINLFDNSGMYETDGENRIYPDVLKADGRFFLQVLNSHKPEKLEGLLRGIGEILNSDFIELVHFKDDVFELLADKLPAMVKYEEKPANIEGFWVGTDYKGEPVEINFLHTPAMLITGASGSGKSVFGRVLVEEATKSGYEVYIADGKGGIDWMDAPCKALLIDMEKIAEHYEGLVDEMNKRLSQLVEFRSKNWIEATEAGHEMQPILSFMDESSDFFDVGSKSTDKNYAVKWRIINAVSELCRKSRAVGIYQAFSLQAAKADSVPNDVKNNSGFRVSYALPTAAMSQTLFESAIAFDPTLRQGKGVFKGVEGAPVVFRGAYVG